MENNTPTSKKKFDFYKIINIILIILVLLLIAKIYTTPKETEVVEQVEETEEVVEPFSVEREVAAELGLLPNMTREEVQDRLNRKVAESMFNVSINPVPSFPNGKSAGNVRIENIPGNSYSFTVEIVRNDTGKTILKTGLIDPGYFIEEMPLDVELPKGVYACVAKFVAYNSETLAQIGEAGTQVLISVRE